MTTIRTAFNTPTLTMLALCAALLAGPCAQAGAALPVSLPDFSVLVEQAGPAVVNVRTTGKATPAARDGGDDEQARELLRRFFGAPTPHARPPAGAPDPAEPARPSGVGAGFITSADGYVMTNAHVVDGADEVFVTLTDQREFKARVVGADARTDVALLKIDANALPTVAIGSSATTRVGEWVIAIGSPFDLDNTVTAGIVSAKARETGDFLPFIQTDVAVNPGNSGGPLINLRGQVVGINSQIVSRSGGYMGISFAIPIDEAMRVAEQLRVSGHVTRGRMGVYLGDLKKDIAQALGLASARGGMVGHIERGGPADRAGLQEGDIVLKFNDIAIDKSAQLRRLAAATPPGTRVRLSVWRKGGAQELGLTLAELEAEGPERAAPVAPAPPPAHTANVLGLVVSTLAKADQKEAGRASGVVIDEVDAAASGQGLRVGDVILTINNVDAGDAQQFARLLAGLKPLKPALLLVRRGEQAQFLSVRPKTAATG